MKLKTLIVEDESLAALLLKLCLESYGCEVGGTVSTGELAVEVAKTMKPDILFMDILLAGKMDGIEAAKIIKTNDPPINIVYISAYSDPQIIEKAQAVGSCAYIQKPFEPEFLKATVEMIRHRLSGIAEPRGL